MRNQSAPPSHEDDFESLCLAMFQEHWHSPDAQRNGRRGNRQHGVDFYGLDPGGLMHGWQCKLHEAPHKLTSEEVRAEVELAKKFIPRLNQFVIATSSKRDLNLQKYAAQVTAEHKSQGLFAVSICSWDDLIELGKQHEEKWLSFQSGISAKLLGDIRASLLEAHTNLSEAGIRRIFSAIRADGESAQYRAFEKEYLSQVLRQYSRISLLGVRDLKDLRQALSIAYVSLRVKVRNAGDKQPRAAEAILAEAPLLTIRGPAGSGKTTLLSWVALQCASEDENTWTGGVPFFVRLRELPREGATVPDVNRFVQYTVDPKLWPAQVPSGWVMNILSQKRGIVLVDGVDELPPELREDFWGWVSSFLQTYPGNRVVITSRFFPSSKGGAERLWNPPKPFSAAELDEMTDEDVAQFIGQWHAAIIANEEDHAERLTIEAAAQALPKRLAEGANARINELCRTPLLCSLVCVLHLREEGYLPTKRVELYERCCSLLLEERDIKRRIPPPPAPLSYLTRDDKEMLLQRLALEMMRNSVRHPESNFRIEVSRRDAVTWLTPVLQLCERSDARLCNPDDVIDHLIERSGLLREPALGFIDFPHRTFQEYLAAGAAGATWQSGYLVHVAENDQWHETIVLAAGTKAGGVKFGEKLIEELLGAGEDRGNTRRKRHTCLAIATACLETAKQITESLRSRVLNHIPEIVPPTNFSEAKALAAAGDAIVPHLAYDKVARRPNKGRVVAACARALTLVNTEKAIDALRSPHGYPSDRRQVVVEQLCRCRSIDPLTLFSVRQLLERRGSIPPFVLEVISSFDRLADLPHLTHLNLDNYQRRNARQLDLTPLSNLTRLQVLALSGFTGIQDLSPLATLSELRKISFRNLPYAEGFSSLTEYRKLENLSLIDCGRLHDLRWLRHSHRLEELLLARCDALTDLAGFESINRLKSLHLVGCSQISVLDPVTSLSGLKSLYIYDQLRITDWHPIGDLGSLENCAMLRASLPTLEVFERATHLKYIAVDSCAGLTSLHGIGKLPRLSQLVTCRLPGVDDLGGISGLKSLHALAVIDLPAVKSIKPLSGLKNLKYLSIIDCPQIHDLEPLVNCQELTEINLCGASEIFGWGALLKLPKLTRLLVSEELAADIPTKLEKKAKIISKHRRTYHYSDDGFVHFGAPFLSSRMA